MCPDQLDATASVHLQEIDRLPPSYSLRFGRVRFRMLV